MNNSDPDFEWLKNYDFADAKHAAINNSNVFEALMDAVRACSLGQITHAPFEAGAQCRRNR